MQVLTESTGNVRQMKKDQSHYIKEISRKTVFPWVPHAILDWCIIVAAFAFAAWAGPLAILPAVLLIGNRQHALAILGHEGVHYALHDNKRVNDLLSNVFCFWPLLFTIEGYRALHFTHHKNTGTKDDPELMHKGARAPQWDLPLSRKKLALYALKDLVGYSLPDLAIILTFSRPEKKALLLPVAVLHVAAVAGLAAAGLWWVPVMWYASMAVGFMVFFRLRLWIEHQGTFDTQRVQLNGWQAFLLAPHNIWLHWEHHQWPTVPYHKLKAARRLVAEPRPVTLSELVVLLENAPAAPSGAHRLAETLAA